MNLGVFTVTTAGEPQTGSVVYGKTFLIAATGDNAGNIKINRLGSASVIELAAGERLPLPGPFLHQYEFDCENDGESFSYIAFDA